MKWALKSDKEAEYCRYLYIFLHSNLRMPKTRVKLFSYLLTSEHTREARNNIQELCIASTGKFLIYSAVFCKISQKWSDESVYFKMYGRQLCRYIFHLIKKIFTNSWFPGRPWRSIILQWSISVCDNLTCYFKSNFFRNYWIVYFRRSRKSPLGINLKEILI